MNYSKQIMYNEITPSETVILSDKISMQLDNIQSVLSILLEKYNEIPIKEFTHTLQEFLNATQNYDILLFIKDKSAEELKEFTIPMMGSYQMDELNGKYYLNISKELRSYFNELHQFIRNKSADPFDIGKRSYFLIYLRKCLNELAYFKLTTPSF